MGKVLIFKLQIGKEFFGQTIGGQSVILPNFKLQIASFRVWLTYSIFLTGNVILF